LAGGWMFRPDLTAISVTLQVRMLRTSEPTPFSQAEPEPTFMDTDDEEAGAPTQPASGRRRVRLQGPAYYHYQDPLWAQPSSTLSVQVQRTSAAMPVWEPSKTPRPPKLQWQVGLGLNGIV
jgi:hypothetical protein